VGAPGMVAALSLMIAALLTVLATGLLAMGYRETQIAANEQGHIQALFNGEAGLEEAKMRLSPTAPPGVLITPVANTAWRAYILSGHTQAEIQSGLDPTYGKDPATGYTTAQPTGNYTFANTVQGAGGISWGWARIEYKVNGAGQIVYLNSVDGTETTASSQTVNGSPVNNFPIFLVTVRGVAGRAQREVRLELQPIIQTTTTQTTEETTVVTNPFAEAAHGKDNVTLVGNAITDSYNSNIGAYNVNGNRGNNGNVGTDSVAAAAISLTGNARVNGNAAVGPGGNTSAGISVTENAAITGVQGLEAAAWNLPLSTIPSGVTNQGALSISGTQVMNLPMGVYWFSSISITGNARLQATGPVKIYVTGNVNIAGNGVSTASNKPPNMLIYGTADPNNPANRTTSVSIGGNGNFYGAVYAPEATITAHGNGAVFGALTGKTVTLNGNGGLHWDEALQNLGAIPSTVVTTTSTTTYSTTGFKRYLWREAVL
jgi:hypothetical protein